MQATPEKAALVEKAAQQAQRAFDRVEGLLLTRNQVRAWMNENMGTFRERMREVRQGCRRQLSVRLQARADLPSP